MFVDIMAWFVAIMFYVVTPLVFLTSLVLLWIEDR